VAVSLTTVLVGAVVVVVHGHLLMAMSADVLKQMKESFSVMLYSFTPQFPPSQSVKLENDVTLAVPGYE
jgi:hypothetical protein